MSSAMRPIQQSENPGELTLELNEPDNSASHSSNEYATRPWGCESTDYSSACWDDLEQAQLMLGKRDVENVKHEIMINLGVVQ